MINHAKKLALKSNHRTHKHATLILKGGRLLAAGYNRNTHHSEENAILSLPSKKARSSNEYPSDIITQVKGTYFINVMLTRMGVIGKSRPCNNCWNVMRNFGVSKVTYYDGNEWITERVK
jgi:deoxycytidylate deaminase